MFPEVLIPVSIAGAVLIVFGFWLEWSERADQRRTHDRSAKR